MLTPPSPPPPALCFLGQGDGQWTEFSGHLKPQPAASFSQWLLSLHYSNHINPDRHVFITVLTTAISHPVMRRLIMSLEQS